MVYNKEEKTIKTITYKLKGIEVGNRHGLKEEIIGYKQWGGWRGTSQGVAHDRQSQSWQAHPWVVPLGTSHLNFSGPIKLWKIMGNN